jgi:hypothetical protein
MTTNTLTRDYLAVLACLGVTVMSKGNQGGNIHASSGGCGEQRDNVEVSLAFRVHENMYRQETVSVASHRAVELAASTLTSALAVIE